MNHTHAIRFLQQCIVALSHGRIDATANRESATLGEINLLPHQLEGAQQLRALLDLHGGALLADEVGLGKTYTALQLARDVRRILIIAPASLRPMWSDACRRAGNHSATITSYERLSIGSLPPAGQWDLVILDEAHHARSASTKRYDALCTLTRGAQLLLLTATPIHNRPADLHSLLALFLGAAADNLDEATLSTLIVRRQERDLPQQLPTLDSLQQHRVPRAEEVFRALRSLPPPLPPADGGVARALVALQLTRAWCSSDAALLAAIRNRLATATALEHALTNGRLPTRRDLSAWSAGADGSVQLAFAELMAAPVEPPCADPDRGSGGAHDDACDDARDGIGDGSNNRRGAGRRSDTHVDAALATVRAHAQSLRAIRALVRGSAARDHARISALARVLHLRGTRQAIVFTHSTETAELAFRALRDDHRVALLTGRGARIASGALPRADVLRQFSPPRQAATPGTLPLLDRANASIPPRGAMANDPQQIDVLIASDVVSEGVDLQRAGVVVHLDLPWTVARLEQRIGRVRRLGSSHTAVASHLITPPVDTAELQATLSHLARKAQLSGRTIGRSSLLGDPGLWAGILPAPRSTAPATVRRSIVDALRRLETLASRSIPNSIEPSRLARSHACTSRAPPSRGDRWSILRRESATTLALITLDDETHLLCAHDTEVTLDPATVLARLDALTSDVEASDVHASDVHASDVHASDVHASGVHASGVTAAGARVGDARATEARCGDHGQANACALEALVHAWCAARCAADLLSLPNNRNSPSHRRLVHVIDRLASRAPRARRAPVAAAATEARVLVSQSRGAGIERLLHSLVQNAPAERAYHDETLRWLRHVSESLRRASSAPLRAATSPASRGAVLHAMLTLVPVHAPA